MHYEVSEGEYHQTLNRSGNEVQRKELEMRRDKEEEAKRTENEVKMEEGRTQRMEGFTRHVENSTRRFGGEDRRLVQDPTLQVAKRQEDEVGRKDEEARLKGETTRAMEEEFRRKAEEHNMQWQELHSLEDLTNKVQRRSSYPVASGGFGDIWKGDLVKHSRVFQVAVKTIRAFESDSNEVARKKANRVRRELKVWERLKHNSILPLWGVADDFGPYLAMVCPWADNGALTGFLELRQYKLSLQDKFLLLNDIALGLQYLHRKSVVHGDLTGSNVLIYGNGRACLADFGLSTIIVEFIGTSYFTSSIRGNVRWVAAELCEATEDSEVSLSAECDIYSFGSITLQILTCKVPYYYVKSDMVVLGHVIKGKKPEPPKDLRIAPGHWSFIQRCWLPRASRPSVGEIVAFVERALSS
ncbi:kinase-like domain-containing protein [Suillus subalutaceus]|uniref:kinase-like domain-containing protein n=1 Tax=Suillus subalutaceus TaxID=48586 RepID=UPI001B882591|nr:kinase-like domain-containing protein [Suillus subalutaceus]KAG1867299.1 kinase-like domain-containing protein [Suillus subalutaceus]